MALNITSIQTASDGVWQGDNPLNSAFPLLIVQTILVLAVSRLLAFFLKPLRQPRVVAEIVGGILLGPSALGRNKDFLQWVFPPWSTPILESVASIGLLFFLFLVGLELDLSSIRHSGKIAFPIALAGVSLPFIFAAGVTLALKRILHEHSHTVTPGYWQTLIFLGVSLSITAFPVLARILAELRLLTTRVGQTAMAAAAFNDVAAWVLLALAVALASNGPTTTHHSPLITIWILLSSIAFVVFMLAAVRPAMGWVAKRCSPEHDIMDEAWICLTLAGVMLSGFMTDLIGIHAIFGAFVFGLCIPKGGDFATRLIKRIEDFVSSLLLPLYFASSGLKTNVSAMNGIEAWGALILVISTACTGKILGTFIVALLCTIPARESLTLGLLMNTKGLVELIVLNIGREKKVLNDEMFTILVLMAIFTTFMTTPMVLAVYKPARVSSSRSHRRYLKQDSMCSSGSSKMQDKELRVLSCVHGPGDVSSMVNLIELTRGDKKNPLKLYSMHLVELTDRSSSILMVHRARKNGLSFVSRFIKGKPQDQVAIAFGAYAEVSRVAVRPTTAIAGLHTMHEDICHVAKQKRTTMIILPFHKKWRGDGEDGMEKMGHGWRVVNRRVLQNAPCSVAILLDRGFGGIRYPETEDCPRKICVLFLGGPDDHEALELGGRMSESSLARVTVVRFVRQDEQNSTTVDSDKAQLEEFQNIYGQTVEYKERIASDIINQAVSIGQTGEYELIVVGKGRFPATMVTEVAQCSVDYEDLGPIGDALASPSNKILSSVLVIQQHDHSLTNDATAPKVMETKEASV